MSDDYVKPGRFIVFEGDDGAGKSTQMDMLWAWLGSVTDREIVRTFEPGATDLGRQLRDAVLHGDHVDSMAEMLLYTADRAHHVRTVIRPALERGAIVLCDRYIDSTIAYQGEGRELDMRRVRDLQWWATSGLLPDVTILLDVDTPVGRARVGGVPDRLEREPDAFHQKVREMYLTLAAADVTRYLVIDAGGTREDIHAKITGFLRARFGVRA